MKIEFEDFDWVAIVITIVAIGLMLPLVKGCEIERDHIYRLHSLTNSPR